MNVNISASELEKISTSSWYYHVNNLNHVELTFKKPTTCAKFVLHQKEIFTVILKYEESHPFDNQIRGGYTIFEGCKAVGFPLRGVYLSYGNIIKIASDAEYRKYKIKTLDY